MTQQKAGKKRDSAIVQQFFHQREKKFESFCP